MKLAKESKISLLAVTACYVLLGLVLLFCPQFTVTMLCYAVGGISVVYGVSRVVAYALRQDCWTEPYRFDLVVGLVFAGGGLYAILQAGVVAGLLNIVVGLAVCLDSLVKLQTAIDLKRLCSRVWISVLVLSLVTGTLGVLAFLYQGTGILSSLQFVGVCLVLDGCVNIWSFTFLAMSLGRLRKARRLQAEQEAAQAAADAPGSAAAPDPAQTEAAPLTDEVVRGGLLQAFDALKKKHAAAQAGGEGGTLDSTDGAKHSGAFEAPAQAAVLLLKPTDEELGAPAQAQAAPNAAQSEAAAAAEDATDMPHTPV